MKKFLYVLGAVTAVACIAGVVCYFITKRSDDFDDFDEFDDDFDDDFFEDED